MCRTFEIRKINTYLLTHLLSIKPMSQLEKNKTLGAKLDTPSKYLKALSCVGLSNVVRHLDT